MIIYNHKKLQDLLSDDTLNLSGVARKCGCSRTVLTEYKNGKSKPSLDKLGKLATILKKPISFFFDESFSIDKHPA